MAIVDTIKDLYRYRENISDIIRVKGIDIPENTKLKYIPQYINKLVKPDEEEAEEEWTEEFQDRCVADSLANYIDERSSWSGHVDANGLREIGWTEEDIQYFQINGVDWNEEDDDKYLVSDYEKELYNTNAIRVVDKKVDGVTIKATYTSTLINNNDPQIVEWRNSVRWLPKIEDTMPTIISFRNFRELIGVPNMDFSKTTNPSYLFARCDKLRCIPPISFATATTSTWNGSYIFYECAKIKTTPISINWEKANTITYCLADCIDVLYLPEINVPNVTSLNNAFTNCQQVIGISTITTSDKLTNCADAFAGCRHLLTAPLFNTSNVTTMQNMFGNCQSINNIPSYDVSKVTNFSNFFKNCSNLLSCPNLNFSPNVTTYSAMFIGCEKLIALPTTMDFTSCTNISDMCSRCLKITEIPYKLNLNNLATSAAEGIKSYSNAIYFCSSLKKVSLGTYRHNATSPTAGTLISYCPFIEEIDVDDLCGEKGNVLASTDLFRVLKIGGELKGISQSVNLSIMRKLPKTEMLKLIDAIEDVNGLGYTPTLTFGTEALRNLTNEEKLIATNKGWKLA